MNRPINPNFNYSNIDVSDLLKEAIYCAFGNVTTKRLKKCFVCAPPLNNMKNAETITQKVFLKKFKLAGVTPLFKKEEVFFVKKNYRSVTKDRFTCSILNQ